MRVLLDVENLSLEVVLKIESNALVMQKSIDTVIIDEDLKASWNEEKKIGQ